MEEKGLAVERAVLKRTPPQRGVASVHKALLRTVQGYSSSSIVRRPWYSVAKLRGVIKNAVGGGVAVESGEIKHAR